MLLNKAVDLFLLTIRSNGFSIETIKLYDWCLKFLVVKLDNPKLKDIKEDDLIMFWDWIRNDYKPKRNNKSLEPLAGRSLENIWAAERSFFNWAIKTGKIDSRPDIHIDRPRYAEREILPLTSEQVQDLLTAAMYTKPAKTNNRKSFQMKRPTYKRDVAIIGLLVDTGIRVSECARIRFGDFSFDELEVIIQPFGSGRKTKQRTLPFGKNTKIALLEYRFEREEKENQLLDYDDLFFISSKGNPMDRTSIRHMVIEIGRLAGIRNANPHRLRHTFASFMASQGASEFEIMKFLGQTSSKMASRYVHLHNIRNNRSSVLDMIKRK